MKLNDATYENIAEELDRRGEPFVMIVDDCANDDINVFGSDAEIRNGRIRRILKDLHDNRHNCE